MTPLIVATPPDRVPPLFPELINPTEGANTETSPEGVPVAGATTATVTFAVTAVPCTMVPGFALLLMRRVDVVALKVPTAVPQAVARLATFTDPRPVARL
jgi:hypothetical protein